MNEIQYITILMLLLFILSKVEESNWKYYYMAVSIFFGVIVILKSIL